MTSPFRKLGVLYIAATPALAGVAMFDVKIGSFNYTGFIWIAQLLAGLLLLALILLTGRKQLYLGVWAPWLVWVSYVWLSLLWCHEMDGKNVQDAMQYTMPVVVGIIAATVVRTAGDFKLLLAGFVFALAGEMVYTALYLGEVFDPEWLITHVRSAALTTTMLGCVFLAAFPDRWLLPLAGWGACVAITAATSSRMATLALLAVFILHPLFRAAYWKLAAVACIGVLGLALFYSPNFQKHSFSSGTGSVSDVASGNVDSLGRGEAWGLAWERAVPYPMLGQGVGSIHRFVETIWDETNQIHNDYLRLFYEVGLVGLTIFLIVAGWQLYVLRRLMRSEQGIRRTALAGAYLGLTALLITCLTDNTITYNLFYTDLLFAVLGASYGLVIADRLPVARVDLADAQWKLELARRRPKYHGTIAPAIVPPYRGITYPNQ